MIDALAIFNSIEAVFWMTVAVVVWCRSRSRRPYQRLGLVAACWFFLFGLSDVWEVFSGAWWRPWPLLALKAVCVIALMSCGIAYRGIVR
jgi:hypothetical protein